MRINKFLANCNLGSRRKVEEFIKAGEIIINGKICTNLGTQVNKEDIVKYKGKILKPSLEKIYLALNKPKEYLVTKTDTHDRRTIYSLLPEKYQNLKYDQKPIDWNFVFYFSDRINQASLKSFALAGRMDGIEKYESKINRC